MGRACSRGSGCRPPARHVSRAAGSRGSADGLCLAARWFARKLRPAPTCPGAGTRGEEAGGPGHEVSMRAGVQPWRAMRCAREERAGFFFLPPGCFSAPESIAFVQAFTWAVWETRVLRGKDSSARKWSDAGWVHVRDGQARSARGGAAAVGPWAPALPRLPCAPGILLKMAAKAGRAAPGVQAPRVPGAGPAAQVSPRGCVDATWAGRGSAATGRAVETPSRQMGCLLPASRLRGIVSFQNVGFPD